jgi:hypothetical protein
MEVELRKKIQEAACLVLVPTEEGHRSRHPGLAKVSYNMVLEYTN